MESEAEPLPVYSLEELISRINGNNKHDFSETDFGGPVGLEFW